MRFFVPVRSTTAIEGKWHVRQVVRDVPDSLDMQCVRVRLPRLIEPQLQGGSMGKFRTAVQLDEVAGPLRSQFKLKNWTAEHSKLREDGSDDALYQAGLLVHSKANHIRKELKLTFSVNFRATTKVRAFAAIVNYNMITIREHAKAEIEKVAREHRKDHPGAPVMLHDIASVKLSMPYGTQFGPDEMVQSMVDGVQVPLKRILERSPSMSGNAEFGKLNFDDLRADFFLGSVYASLEALWDDCLWNGYVHSGATPHLEFSSEDETWQVREVVGRARKNSLSREFAAYSADLQKALPYERLGLIDVKTILKGGRKQKLLLAPIDLASKEASWLLTMRAYASEPYYSELLDEPQAKLKGATVNELMTAWSIVSKSGHLLQDALSKKVFPKPEEANTWLPDFAPVLQVEALVTAIATACGTSRERSQALVDFLIFRGSPEQEMWAQPLLPASESAVIPVFATTSSPNLRRLVDVWLRQLGVDLSLRGPAFEAYVRGELANYMASSPLLAATSKCLRQGLNFTPLEGRSEEIDLVAIVGHVVLIGEAKCFLEPTEPKEVARHRHKILDAVAQVKRKAIAVEQNKAAFRARAAQVGLDLPEEYEVLPIVVLNAPFHAGIAVDDVPVVDEYILGVFFRGELVQVAVKDPGAGFNPIRKRVLYGSAEEGALALRAVMMAPPQMEPLLAGVSRQWVPFLPVNEEDWTGAYLALDCRPNVDLSFLDGVVPGAPVNGL